MTVTRRVLVTDGEQRAALAVVRSLGRAGFEVFVCSSQARSIAGASKFATAEAAVPDPLTEPKAFVSAVTALIDRWKIAVLLPMTDAALLALLPVRQQIGPVVMPCPELESFRSLSDKALLLEVAAGEGIAIPEQQILDCPSAAAALLSNGSVHFPLVLKPARSVTENSGTRQKWGVTHSANAAELEANLRRTPAAAFPLLMQRRIEGEGVGVFVLLWQGKLLASFAHRRLREKPPSGGVSVYRESTEMPPALLEKSLRLLRHFDWSGVAMIEYKIDAQTGTPYLMEINGRFWGSLQLAIDAGVDFPRLLVEAATGQQVTPVHTYQVGVRSRWWWGDVDHLIARVRRSPAELHLPRDAPSRARALIDFIRPGGKHDRNEVLRLSDPRPFIRESLEWFRDLRMSV